MSLNPIVVAGRAAAVLVACVAAVPAAGQQMPDIGFESVGRGAPLAASLPTRLPPAQPEQAEKGL